MTSFLSINRCVLLLQPKCVRTLFMHTQEKWCYKVMAFVDHKILGESNILPPNPLFWDVCRMQSPRRAHSWEEKYYLINYMANLFQLERDAQWQGYFFVNTPPRYEIALSLRKCAAVGELRILIKNIQLLSVRKQNKNKKSLYVGFLQRNDGS